MKCKPGDLAFIVASAYPENIGAVVRVMEPFGDGISWVCKSEGRPLAATKIGGKVYGDVVAAFDGSLRPIRGDPVSEPSQEHAELPA